MRRALALAARGWGRVAPNPMVGAVVARGDEIVGEGYHAEWGGPHAEVTALEDADDEARGATLYVTLEPCHHTGKTGPCSRRILDAGIARLVYATAERNPEARGAASWLRERGVEVLGGICEGRARDLNAIHLSVHARQRPFVSLKYAMSVDARLAEAPGRPTRVTEEPAVREAHRLRAGHDAIMVGIGTVLADDPQLTVRAWKPGPRRPPLRVVLDSSLRLPQDSALASSAADVPVLVFASPEASRRSEAELRRSNVEVVRIPRSAEGVGLDLVACVSTLRQRGVHSVLCEGGGALGSSLLRAGLVDRLYAFVAPLLFGEPGVAAFSGERGRGARDWRLIERRALDATTLLALAPVSAPEVETLGAGREDARASG